MCFRTKVSVLLLALFVGAGVFSMNVQPAEAVSLAELQLIIQDLKAKIAELQAQLKAVQAQQQEQEWCHNFNKNLRIGDKGADIIALHKALEKAGFGPFDRGGDSFNAFNHFTEATASAVVGFQEKYRKEILAQWGLKHGTGFVGKSTRAKLNKLYGCGITPIYTPKCQETDNMQDYYTKGVVTFSGNKSVDYCVDNNTLKEYWCTGMGGVEWVHNIDYTCPNGCVDGACKRDGEYRPSITVTSPNDGEQWVIGNTYPIKWNSTGYTSKKEITISLIKKDVSELVYDELIAVSSNTGYYNWRVGTISTGVTIEPGEYKIRIVTGEIEGGGGGVVVDRSDYFSIVKEETGANLPPVIGGITAPTQLRVNEKGVWTVKARDPENGSLSYSVNWGDKYANIALPESAPAEIDTRTQTTTFTHSYSRIGTYTIRFTVTDDHRQTARTSATIKIGGSEIVCTDSDGGINKYVRGRTCRDLYNLKQDSDSPDLSTNRAGFGRFCRTDKCVYLPDQSPILEGSAEYYITNNYVEEYYCSNNRIFSKTLYCENGCANGACKREIVKPSCVDSDGGKDYYKKGVVTLKQAFGSAEGVRQVKDFCEILDEENSSDNSSDAVGTKTNTLYEYYCDGNEIGLKGFVCPNGCADGACVKGNEPYCSAIGSKSQGWYQNGQRIEWDNCDGCYAICMHPGTDSEGWYSSCDNAIESSITSRLIKYANCAEGQEEPSITVTSPNGGEQWVVGDTYEIAWNSTGVEKVDIELLEFDSEYNPIGDYIGGAYGAIVSGGAIENKGYYNWTIPESILDNALTEPCYFKIFIRQPASESGTPVSDRSDDYFSIIEAQDTTL